MNGKFRMKKHMMYHAYSDLWAAAPRGGAERYSYYVVCGNWKGVDAKLWRLRRLEHKAGDRDWPGSLQVRHGLLHWVSGHTKPTLGNATTQSRGQRQL
jgi:hypothetical protein